MSFLKYAGVAIFTAAMALTMSYYMETKVPEGVPEVWHAKIIDAALRTNGKVIFALINLGVKGGTTWWTRTMVNTVITTLITGSPFGKGSDPELKISNTKYDGVDVRVYEPESLKGKKNRPIMVYYHGGGWSWLNVDVYDPVMRDLAKRVPMVVVSVDYRLSPEHVQPIPLNECLKVAEHILKNAHLLDFDPNRLAISGDSAGGHLTAAVSLILKRKIKIQVPLYPALQLFDLQTPSYIENRMYIPGMLNDVSMLTYWMNHGNISYDYIDDFLSNKHTSKSVKKSKYASYVSPAWYMKEHIRTPSLQNMQKPSDFGDEELSKKYEKVLVDPMFAPLMADEEDLKNLPLTYILTAGYDVLRDDGIMYYRRLKKAGVSVHLAHYSEGFHGMLLFTTGPLPFEVGQKALRDLAEFFKENL